MAHPADADGGVEQDSRISVVIPTYNRADLLPRAVRAAFAQTVAPAEVIVADDGGDDETRAMMAQLTAEFGPSLVYTRTPPEIGGASAARNAGARVSRGDVLAFLDDDDWWDAEYLAQAMTTLRAEDAEMVLTPNWIVIDEERRPFMTPSESSFSTFRPGMTGSNIVVTRRAFDRIDGFDPAMWVMNDVDFFVRARSAKTRIVAARERLVYLEGRGVGHLSSASERRALGLEHFIEVHRSEMDRKSIRLVKRRISVARAASAVSIPARVRHTLAVMWFSSVSDYTGTLKRRLDGRRRSY
ncbi:glycosyltransferase family 2 protein [Microbacterium sp. NPDC056003]|uniref:glycosyltransferase family 2 protein n=1 Tax=Microbacterium sp. NPDC056003 TaxID=3345676 RepID=UPI0035E1A668